MEKNTEALEPLPVAAASPRAGERVYAIGSPVLRDQVLEQSISEGIVSAARRRLESKRLAMRPLTHYGLRLVGRRQQGVRQREQDNAND